MQAARRRAGQMSRSAAQERENAMHLMYFTEQPMSAYPAQVGLDFGATALMFPNQHFDPVQGSRIYNEYLEHYILADELGIDGIMLNEHHNAPFCMQAKTNVFASILAAVTNRAKIVILGNPLPLCDNPIRLAEELAMIDMISKGRLVSGFVRGGGQEQLAAGVNPAFNRERFQEAHDLIVKIWTQPGPFRWEGTHYQHRVVNPWAVPLQKPHPRIWIPGVLSKETVIWAAEHGYPYIALNTPVERTKQIWDLYDGVARQAGFAGGSAYHGLLKQIHVAETEEKALENARQFMWMQGEFTGLAHPVWSSPAGYGSPEHRRSFAEFSTGRAISPRARPVLEKQMDELMIIAGTPKQVIQKVRVLLEETRPGILAFWGNDGNVTHEDAKSCIRLLGTEVFPAVREIAKELDLKSPFETDQPVSVRYLPGAEQPGRAAAE
jgi:alkanesulfonate monooxygenase SsuD/methylene tetrahydromethanopterin reductase-like flavin-dependent oxidoreductase (luciferase family)